MIGVTKKEISDSVLFRLAGSYPDSSFPVDERDIWSNLEQRMNDMFKVKHFSVTLQSGETKPDGLMIGTYENVTVTSDGKGQSYSLLPITPITLPMNMGIFLVYDPAYPNSPFIPMQRGDMALLKADALLSDLLGQIGYEVKNNKVVYNKDITQLGVTAVTMEMCVFDLSLYGITDPLPIPADYVQQLQDELTMDFARITPESGIVNNFTNAGQKPPILPKQQK